MKSISHSVRVITALTLFLAPAILSIARDNSDGIRQAGRDQVAVASGTTHTLVTDQIAWQADPATHPGPNHLANMSEAPAVAWSNTFGGVGFDECYSVKQTSDGGYIMAGRSNSTGTGNFDAWVVKTDASGNAEWSQAYGDSYIDEAYMVKELASGGYIVAGMSTAFDWSGEGWLIKIDATGNIIWSKGYHPSTGSTMAAWDYIYDVVEMPDGGFVAAGDAADLVNSTQAWILRVDADGDMVWDFMFGGEFWERFFTMDRTSDGGFIAAGDRHWTYDGITYRHDGWLVKFNENGDTAWSQHFGNVGHDIFRSVKQTTDGGYIVAGERQEDEVASFKGWLLKTDESGNPEWNHTLSPGGLFSVAQLASGNFTAAGTIISGACEGLLMKVDGSGNTLWESTIPGSDLDDIVLGMEPTADGGYILGGKYNSDGMEASYWLVKTEPETMEPLTYFFENYDAVTPPAMPGGWSGLVEKLISNTVAEVRTMEQGSTTSQPNAVFIMNGLDGSNGQLDTNAFVALVSPWVLVGNSGATLTFQATGFNAIQVGTLSDPLDPGTFTLVEEVMPDFNFNEYTVTFTTPGTTWIALKHGNTSTVTPLFVDDAEFKQIDNVALTETDQVQIRAFPNPASDNFTLESPIAMRSVRICNFLGAAVSMLDGVNDKKITLDVSQYPSGTYFATITLGNGAVITKKVIVVN